MFIDQGDLLQDMDMIFRNHFIKTAVEESCRQGDILFREGDRADHFFTLIQGRIVVNIGGDQDVYEITAPGEMFGWSSLVGGEVYTAGARCAADSRMLKFEREELKKLLEKNPENGMLFYKKLAEIMGRRLMKSYKIVLECR